MLEFISEYGLFLAKSVTVLVTFVIAVLAVFAASSKSAPMSQKGSVTVRKINDVYDEYQDCLEKHIFDEDSQKTLKKERKKEFKKQQDIKKKAKKGSGSDQAPVNKPRTFVVEFNGDVKASAVDNLRQEVNAILLVASAHDEIVIDLESPGGMVHTYGLAASQLSRIKAAGIPLTICVDRVAASGGYLMACVGNKILAAPFAIIGSIGVLAQIPNFNKALKRFDVEYDVMTAGEYKAPITMFGENTEKGKHKLQTELEETHELFKSFINDNRPSVDTHDVATGEVWYGQQAINKSLVDEIMTIDDYLMVKRSSSDIYQIAFEEKKSFSDKLSGLSAALVQKTSESLLSSLSSKERMF